jgi:hypothetical protein
MDLAARLANLKKKVMVKIANAAGVHDTRLVASYSALASRIEDDERSIATVTERISRYVSELTDPTSNALFNGAADTRMVHGGRSGAARAEGFSARKTFLDAGRGRGYRLMARGRTIFETPRGRKVAILFANEQRPDRWFLGMSDEKYDVVVLLCQDSDGALFDFILPWEFMEKFWRAFSRSGGQVKFNVSRSGGNWSLLIPGQESQPIQHFLKVYGALLH